MKRKPIPVTGVPRLALLREAVASEWSDVVDLVRAALCTKMNTDWVRIEGMYADRAIVEADDGRCYAYPYTIDASNQVQLGDPTEVVETFTPVREALHTNGVFVEAMGDTGSGKWLIRVIRAGRSGNNNFYPDAVLREAVPLFAGARVFAKSDAEHIKGEGKDVAKLIGGLSNPRFIEGKAPDTGEIQADLVMIEPQGTVATKLREAFDRQLASLFGFSIDADGTAKVEMREGKKCKVATAITRVNSVDLIVEPGAGGELIRLIEAVPVSTSQEQQNMTLRHRMIEAIKAHKPDFDGATATDEAIETAYQEAIAAKHKPAATNTGGTTALDEVRLVEARITARELVGAAKLPQAAKDKILTQFTEAKTPFTAADVTAAIDGERAYLAKFSESGKPVIQFDEMRVEDRSVKVGEMLDAFFNPAHKDHRNVQSFKECYIEITGDRRVTGRIENCDRTRMAESLGAVFHEAVNTGGFTNVLGNSLRRTMIADYNTANEYDIWQPLVGTPVPLADFRTNDRVRFGGYGDLPAVAESGSYTALTTPADEKASYAATKRGGTESITIESIKNDDVGFIRQIPIKMSRAAKRTLAKFVFDFLRTNPTIYDTLALFHASHNNLFSTAFSAAEFAVHRLAMKKQTELTSTDRLGIGPKFIIGPADLEEAMRNAFNRNTNLDKTFIQTLSPTIIPVWYWTDVTDWCTAADPNDIPGIELGFLDGQQEPDLFVQDMPNVGSLFTNDQVTYKIRHVYGGTVKDYRGYTKAVVAG